EEARVAATVGVLESVQVQSTHYPFGQEAFVQWLGPLSRQAWFEIDELWRAGGGPLAGVIRAEKRKRVVLLARSGGGSSGNSARPNKTLQLTGRRLLEIW